MRKDFATREQHAFGREAEKVWLEVAAKVGNPYSARSHREQVHSYAIQATRWATEFQVLAAIRQNLNADSAPIRIPEWARLWTADQQENARARRKAQEHMESLPPNVLAALKLAPKWSHPNSHAYEDDGQRTSTCKCGAPYGVHVHDLAERLEAVRSAAHQSKVHCPECDAWAVRGHACENCGTFLTTGPIDDEHHALAATQRLRQQQARQRPIQQILGDKHV